MRLDTAAKAVNQLLVHVLIVVWNVQTHDLLRTDLFPELPLQPFDVALLHDENEIGPAEVSGCYANSRALLRAGGAHLMSTLPVKDCFCGEAAQPILAADEEHLHRELIVVRYVALSI